MIGFLRLCVASALSIYLTGFELVLVGWVAWTRFGPGKLYYPRGVQPGDAGGAIVKRHWHWMLDGLRHAFGWPYYLSRWL